MLREATSETLPDHIDGDDLLARWGLGILTGGLFLVLICTLFPFNFNLAVVGDFLPSTISRFYGWGSSIDWLNNIVLFVPFGLGLTCLMQKSRLETVPKVATVLMISAGLSVTVEILQHPITHNSVTC